MRKKDCDKYEANQDNNTKSSVLKTKRREEEEKEGGRKGEGERRIEEGESQRGVDSRGIEKGRRKLERLGT